MSTGGEHVTTRGAGCQDGRRPGAVVRAAANSARPPLRSPQMWTETRRGAVAVHGEIDIANHHLFAMVVEAVTNPSDRRAIARGGAHLDLADVDFIDTGGARLLAAAAANRGADNQLVVRRPPAMLVKILQLGWGHLPGLRYEE